MFALSSLLINVKASKAHKFERLKVHQTLHKLKNVVTFVIVLIEFSLYHLNGWMVKACMGGLKSKCYTALQTICCNIYVSCVALVLCVEMLQTLQ